jgi:hypothetical protein
MSESGKKNSKKMLSLSLAAALSAIVFVTTGFAASNNVSGYEKAKEALFALHEMSNYTETLEFSVVEDGVEIMQGSLDGKVDDEFIHSMEMDFTIDGETYTVDTYSTESNSYTKTIESDQYIKTPNYAKEFGGENDGFKITDNQKKLMNIVLDMFVGDTKNYFTNDNGKITMKLEKGQVPEIFQVGLAVMSEAINKELNESEYFTSRHAGSDTISTFFEERMLNVLNNLEIDSVYVEGTIDENNVITDATMTFTLTGEDMDGNPHVTTFSMTNEITDIGTTEVAPFDETGKEIIDNVRNMPTSIMIDGEEIIIEDIDDMDMSDLAELQQLEISTDTSEE